MFLCKKNVRINEIYMVIQHFVVIKLLIFSSTLMSAMSHPRRLLSIHFPLDIVTDYLLLFAFSCHVSINPGVQNLESLTPLSTRPDCHTCSQEPGC